MLFLLCQLHLKHPLPQPPFMHRLVRDALNTALQKLGFPWLTPHPTKTSREIGYFQKAITTDDLYELYKRNQMALISKSKV
jgi:hypothetical protein